MGQAQRNGDQRARPAPEPFDVFYMNQRGSFLRAYLRQQAREGTSAVDHEDDTIKLADKAQLHHGRRKLARLLGGDPGSGRST